MTIDKKAEELAQRIVFALIGNRTTAGNALNLSIITPLIASALRQELESAAGRAVTFELDNSAGEGKYEYVKRLRAAILKED